MVSPSARLPGRLVSVTDARAAFSRLIAAVHRDGARAMPVFIGRHGEPMAVLLSLEQFHEYYALVALRRRQLAQLAARAAAVPSPAGGAKGRTPSRGCDA